MDRDDGEASEPAGGSWSAGDPDDGPGPSAADLQAVIDDLASEFGAFPVEAAAFEPGPDWYADLLAEAERGSLGASRVWVERGEEVLLVRPHYAPDTWAVPGGVIEPGETATEAALREVREETGVECTVQDVVFAVRDTYHPPDPDDPLLHDVAVALVAEYESGSVRPEEGEIHAVEWFADLPDAVHPPIERIAADRF